MASSTDMWSDDLLQHVRMDPDERSSHVVVSELLELNICRSSTFAL